MTQGLLQSDFNMKINQMKDIPSKTEKVENEVGCAWHVKIDL